MIIMEISKAPTPLLKAHYFFCKLNSKVNMVLNVHRNRTAY